MTHYSLWTMAFGELVLVLIPLVSLSQTRASKPPNRASATANTAKHAGSQLLLTHPVARKLLAIEDELNAVVKARVNVEATLERYRFGCYSVTIRKRNGLWAPNHGPPHNKSSDRSAG
jgi:hypothetical protein